MVKLLAIAERAGSRVWGLGSRQRQNVPSSSPRPETRDPSPDSSPDPISLRVHPTLVHKADLLADVSGSFNAISFYGHALGHAFFYGRGAGRMPTASAVVSDLIAVAIGTAPLMFKQLNIYPDTSPAAKILPMAELKRAPYHLPNRRQRSARRDWPGLVSQILGQHGISIASIHQHETASPTVVPSSSPRISPSEGAMSKALAQISALPTVRQAAGESADHRSTEGIRVILSLSLAGRGLG